MNNSYLAGQVAKNNLHIHSIYGKVQLFLCIIEGPIVFWEKWADSIYLPLPIFKKYFPSIKESSLPSFLSYLMFPLLILCIYKTEQVL